GGLLIVEDTARRGQSRAPESTGGPARRFRPGTTGSHQNGPGTRTAVECRTGRFDGSACSVDHALAVVAVTGDGIELAEVLLVGLRRFPQGLKGRHDPRGQLLRLLRGGRYFLILVLGPIDPGTRGTV